MLFIANKLKLCSHEVIPTSSKKSPNFNPFFGQELGVSGYHTH